MKKQFKIRSLLKAKKQKFDVPEVTPLMKGDCVCESPCNEYCSTNKKTETSKKIDDFSLVLLLLSEALEKQRNYVQPINTEPKQE